MDEDLKDQLTDIERKVDIPRHPNWRRGLKCGAICGVIGGIVTGALIVLQHVHPECTHPTVTWPVLKGLMILVPLCSALVFGLTTILFAFRPVSRK